VDDVKDKEINSESNKVSIFRFFMVITTILKPKIDFTKMLV
jgi:hypothetical protein